MKITNLHRLFLLNLLIFFISLNSFSQSNQNQLHLIKKIYIGELTEDITVRKDLILNSLKEDLTKAGFEIVTERKFADAILTTEAAIWVTLDGNGTNEPRSYYLFKLTSQNDQSLWKQKIFVPTAKTI